jgi:hypothetical protein
VAVIAMDWSREMKWVFTGSGVFEVLIINEVWLKNMDSKVGNYLEKK